MTVLGNFIAELEYTHMYNTAFLFDLDGVLIDSEREYTRIWEEVDQKWPTGVENFAQVIKGTTLYEILHRYFPTEQVRQDVLRYCIDREENMEFRLCEGAAELLAALRERSIPSVVVTSSDRPKMERLYQRLPDFRAMFDSIVDGDMVTHSKPHPEGYLRAAKLEGCDPRHCVVFEDSLTGIQAGRAAGAYVVGITGTFPREAIEAQHPDMVIDNLAEIDLDGLLQLITNNE